MKLNGAVSNATVGSSNIVRMYLWRRIHNA